MKSKKNKKAPSEPNFECFAPKVLPGRMNVNTSIRYVSKDISIVTSKSQWPYYEFYGSNFQEICDFLIAPLRAPSQILHIAMFGKFKSDKQCRISAGK